MSQRDELLSLIREHLSMNDSEAIDVIMAVALAIYLPGDPLWIHIVGPPGAGKTELVRAITGKNVITLSTLTPQSLISGLSKAGPNTDLLPRLDGKLLVIKDFTSILSRRPEDATAVYADLREAYDGYIEKAYGSGVGVKSFHARFGVITAVTPAIDLYRNVHDLLGERFLRLNLPTQDEALKVQYALDGQGREPEWRPKLSAAVRTIHNRDALGQAEVDPQVSDRLVALARLVASWRTPVHRDRTGSLNYGPEREVGTRVAKQFYVLLKALALWRGREHTDEADYATALRVASDSLPRQRLDLLRFLSGPEPFYSASQVGEELGLTDDTARRYLHDLYMLGLLGRQQVGNTQGWYLSDLSRTLIADSGLVVN